MNGGLLARRLGIVAVCVVSLVGCVGLAWWQWERFDSSGSWQNLGYVLQWPLFGLFPAFMFWRLRKLRREPGDAAAPDATPDEAPATARAETTATVETTAPAEAVPDPWAPTPRPTRQDDDDPELAEYNRYLARLNELDQQESR